MSLTGRPTRADQPARTRLIEAQAEKVERFNLVEAGELVRAVDVAAAWADMLVTVRTRLLIIPSRLASRHPGNARLIADLDVELHDALDMLANDL